MVSGVGVMVGVLGAPAWGLGAYIYTVYISDVRSAASAPEPAARVIDTCMMHHGTQHLPATGTVCMQCKYYALAIEQK